VPLPNPHEAIATAYRESKNADALADRLREILNQYRAASDTDIKPETAAQVADKLSAIVAECRTDAVRGDVTALARAVGAAEQLSEWPPWLHQRVLRWAVDQLHSKDLTTGAQGQQARVGTKSEAIHAALNTYGVYQTVKAANREYKRRGSALALTAKIENVSAETVRKRIAKAKKYGARTVFGIQTG